MGDMYIQRKVVGMPVVSQQASATRAEVNWGISKWGVWVGGGEWFWEESVGQIKSG